MELRPCCWVSVKQVATSVAEKWIWLSESRPKSRTGCTKLSALLCIGSINCHPFLISRKLWKDWQKKAELARRSGLFSWTMSFVYNLILMLFVVFNPSLSTTHTESETKEESMKTSVQPSTEERVKARLKELGIPEGVLFTLEVSSVYWNFLSCPRWPLLPANTFKGDPGIRVSWCVIRCDRIQVRGWW